MMNDISSILADLGGPEIFAAPFWKLFSIGEHIHHGLVTGDAARARQEFHVADDWPLALFSIATDRGRLAVSGWVKPPFAIYETTAARWAASLTHLPSGRSLLLSEHAEEAAEIAAIILPLADWELVTTSDVHLLQAVRDRLHGAGFAGFKVERDGFATAAFRRLDAPRAGNA